MTATIDILVPVLARPQNAQPLVDSIRANTTVPWTLLFLTTPGDHAQFDACARTGMNVLEIDTPAGHGDYATKINRGYQLTSAPYVLCAADDLEFTPEWDVNAIAVARASLCGVIGTNDMANKHVMNGGFSTHPIVTRLYIERDGGTTDSGPGVIYHEGYDHNYPDRELAGVAQWRNQWAFALESRIIHKHPGWQNPRADATYKKGGRRFRQDHSLFLQRSSMWDHVGLVPQELRVVGQRGRVPR